MLASPSSRRLITQNLLAGAALHEDKRHQITWDTVRDLSVLIDLFCLYDRLEIMGRQAYSMLPKVNSDFHGALTDVLHVDNVKGEKVLNAACGHLVAFLGERSVTELSRFFIGCNIPILILRAYSPLPDGPDEVATGKMWLQTLLTVRILSRKTIATGTSIGASPSWRGRSSILAQADASGLTLTPDNARSAVLETVNHEEKKD